MLRTQSLYYTCLVLLTGLVNVGFGQSLRSRVDTALLLESDTVAFSGGWLVPGTMELLPENQLVLGKDVVWDQENGVFILNNKDYKGRLLHVSYQKVDLQALNIPSRYSIVEKLDSIYQDTVQFLRSETSSRTRNPVFSNLQRSGLFSRGVRLGTNQDMTVNSNLHLRLDGAISDKLNIRAAVSDYTIPLQPDGTTAQISELDRIFIEVYTKKHSLTAGDFLLRDSSNYMRLRKKWQGLYYKGNMRMSEHWKMKQQTALAIARGVFHRMQFRGIESNQGPYRLVGKNGELAIVILSGSERVYINGDLMKRGANEDYTIDYNTAEITFTLNRPILRESRIIIEFEYANRQYNRYSIFNSSEWGSENTRFFVKYVNTFDDRFAPLQGEYTDEQIEILKAAGNDPTKAAGSSAEQVDFTATEVLYEQVDTITEGITYQNIFKRNYDSNVKSYRVRFTYVGEGMGDYRIVASAENGRVYEWVPPEGDVQQGDYVAVRFFDTPERHQMLAAGFSAFGNRLEVETTASERDLNTFSSLDDKHNLGYGGKVSLGDSLALRDSADYFKYRLNYEYTTTDFRSYEPFQEVEFARNWGLPQQFQFSGHIGSAEIDWKKKHGKLRVKPAYLRGDTGSLEAYRASMEYFFRSRKWKIRSENNVAKNIDRMTSISFVKSINKFERFYRKWKWGGYLKYRQREMQGDTSVNSNFQFINYYAMLGLLGKKKDHITLQVGQRYDFLPTGDGFILDERRDVVNTSGQWASKNNQLSFKANFRRILPQLEEERYRLGTHFRYNWNWWKSRLRGGIFYESNLGLEPGREFQYVKVSKGQGNFKWIDYNGNGVQETNEFEQVVFQDEGEYMKIWYPSSNYVEVRQNKMSANLTFRPRFKKKKGLKRWLSQSIFSTTYRNTTKYEGLPWYEFYTLPTDTCMMLSANGRFNGRYIWRSGKSGWLLELNYRNQQRVITLTNGRDNKQSNTYSVRVEKRWKDWQMGNTSMYIDDNSVSEAFPDRDYSIITYQNRSELVWKGIYRGKMRLFYRYAKKNAEKNDLALQIHHTGIGLDWKLPNALLLKTEVAHVYNEFNTAASTPVTINMLEGFQPGNNGHGRIQFNRRFGKFLELNLIYEARFAEASEPIQTGQVQLKAIF